jgi:hypothetical protein
VSELIYQTVMSEIQMLFQFRTSRNPPDHSACPAFVVAPASSPTAASVSDCATRGRPGFALPRAAVWDADLATSRAVAAVVDQPRFPNGTGIPGAGCRCQIMRKSGSNPESPAGATSQQLCRLASHERVDGRIGSLRSTLASWRRDAAESPCDLLGEEC